MVDTILMIPFITGQRKTAKGKRRLTGSILSSFWLTRATTFTNKAKTLVTNWKTISNSRRQERGPYRKCLIDFIIINLRLLQARA